MDKDFIDELLKGYSNRKVDLSVCKYDNNLNLDESSNYKNTSRILDSDTMIKEILLPRIGIGSFVWNKLYLLNKIIANNIYFDERISVCEDTLFNFNYLSSCKAIFLLEKELYHYRINNTGTMYTKKFNYNKLSGNMAHDIIIESLQKRKDFSLKKYAILGCMLYNIILAIQYKKYNTHNYEYWLDIYEHATINYKLFFLSRIGFKYKLGLLYIILCLKYKIKKDVPSWK